MGGFLAFFDIIIFLFVLSFWLGVIYGDTTCMFISVWCFLLWLEQASCTNSLQEQI